MTTEREFTYQSDDGLSLFCREYGDAAARTVVCLPGLTRNSRDFMALARHLGPRYRVLSPDLRGRGLSQWDPKPEQYNPMVYYRDVQKLLNEKLTQPAAIIGTSLGGILAMSLAAFAPQKIAGIVLNDVGPEIGAEGLARIASYVGLRPAPATWSGAVAQTRANYGVALPDLNDADWEAYARASFREREPGRIVADYDPAIGNLVRAGAAAPADMWPLWAALATKPVLVIRGSTSDILTPATLARMRREKPDLSAVEVPDRGHVPQLNEPVALAAIDGFLARLWS